MDGTLAEWRACEQYEMLYEKGYFRTLRPYLNVVKAAKLLANTGLVEVFSLSAVLPDGPHAIPDKDEWLDEHMAWLDTEHRIFVKGTSPKHEAVPGGIRENDILLDDYTKNCVEWDEYAIAIKLLNGINGTQGTWQGARVSRFETPEDIMGFILRQGGVIR
jgi:Uncharacterized protein conserved in bacteria